MADVHPTAAVAAGAELGEGVFVGPFCVVGPDVKIGAGTRLMSHVVVDGLTKIGGGCAIFPFASIGTQTQDLKWQPGNKTYVEIGDNTTVREYVTINSGTKDGEVTRIGDSCHIMAYCHVAHGSVVGNKVIMANGASLSGEVIVEDMANIGGMTGVHQFVRIGTMCMIGGMSRITQDCMPYMLIAGYDPAVVGVNTIGIQRRGVSREAQAELKHAHRILCRDGLSTSQAMEKMEASLQKHAEVEHLLDFIRKSQRGVIKNAGGDAGCS